MIRKKKTVRREIFDRDGNKCLQCGATENLTIDHIVPKSLGGKSHLDNYQTLCQPCNLKKGAKIRDLRGIRVLAKIDLPTKKIKKPTKQKIKKEPKKEGIVLVSDKIFYNKSKTVKCMTPLMYQGATYFHDDGCRVILNLAINDNK